MPVFDEHAEAYDGWFLKNQNVLDSEVLLLKHFLASPGKTLSVGCGSGLFEYLLRTQHGIEIAHGVEPSEAMAEIAGRRGVEVRIGAAEQLPCPDGEFDTVLLNGTPSYIGDLEKALRETWRVLRPGGSVVVVDVPAESSYGLLYMLVALKGSWDDSRLQGLAPAVPYPVELAAAANWRTTEEKAEALRRVGFVDLEFAQTLTRHPRFSNDSVEEPVEGYDRGDYVAIRALRPSQ
jgi:ubiquinone/menaquinone biosynthesis C-methylase UbiE